MVEELLNLLNFLDWEKKKKIEAQRDLVYRLEVKFKFIKKKKSDLPDSNQRPKDIWGIFPLQSSALPTELRSVVILLLCYYFIIL